MGSVQVKRAVVVSKGSGRRPAGMQAINPALYRQIQQAVRELSQPRTAAAVH
jgi:cobalamin biosynthesis protein CbiD